MFVLCNVCLLSTIRTLFFLVASRRYATRRMKAGAWQIAPYHIDTSAIIPASAPSERHRSSPNFGAVQQRVWSGLNDHPDDVTHHFKHYMLA
jgi:hypothetical protein